jgi:hypothetical protein
MTTTKPLPDRRAPQTNAKATQKRVSQSAGSVMLGKGGLGYIARRGVDYGTSVAMQTVEGVSRLATTQPLQLIALLPSIVPEVDLSDWNFTTLASGPDVVRLKAMTTKADGSQEEDAAGTLAIETLFKSLPDEVGNFTDVLCQMIRMSLYSGMTACEAVPGPSRTGLSAVFPINTLTLRFKRETDGTLGLYQRQFADPNGMGVYSIGMSGVYAPLPQERVFWAKMGGLPDEPYGRSPFAPVLTAVLDCIAFIRDLGLAWHRVGMPAWDIGFDFENWARIAKEIIGLSDPTEIDAWVQKKFDESVSFFNDKEADDVFFHDTKSVVNAVGAGDKWGSVKEMWEIRRSRLTKALKMLPALMGDMEGSTETWSEVEERIFFTGLRNMVSTAVAPLVKAANLHLRLLGMALTCEAEISMPQLTQRLKDAQAKQLEIDNAAAIRDEGWQTQDEASLSVTGSAAVEEVPPKQTQALAMQQAKVGQADANATGQGNPPK